MATFLPPLESAKFIAENSQDVEIPPAGVKKVAQLIFDTMKTGEKIVHTDRWKTFVLHPKTGAKNSVDWVFVSAVGNFSFWSEDEKAKFKVKQQGQEWTGYLAWIAAINRALDEGIPVTDARYLSDLTADKLRHLLRSDSDIAVPLLSERLQVLKEAGKVLLEKYDGSFVNALTRCNNSAQTLLEMIVTDFPSFRDTAVFLDKPVAIYKRAQILIADTWACCGGEGYGQFNDIDSITMFADYRIPQALAWFGALKYSEELNQQMKEGHMFQSGERREVEIRGCTIWAVELAVRDVREMLAAEKNMKDRQVNAILIDHYLWDYRREHAKETEVIPIHRIRTIYY